jgi:uncharacterized protein YkvS
MEHSNENPKIKVVTTPFYVKENVKDMEVPPKAKDYKMAIGVEAGQEFNIEVHDGGAYQLDGNIITFKDGNTRKSGKIVSNSDFEAKRKDMKKVKNSKEIEIA